MKERAHCPRTRRHRSLHGPIKINVSVSGSVAVSVSVHMQSCTIISTFSIFNRSPSRTNGIAGDCKEWACLSFASLLVPFLAILSCRWKSTCDPAMPQISKISKDEAVQRKALVGEHVAHYDQSSDDYNTSSSLKETSNNGFE